MMDMQWIPFPCYSDRCVMAELNSCYTPSIDSKSSETYLIFHAIERTVALDLLAPQQRWEILKNSIQLQELKEEICFFRAYLRIVLPLLSQWSKDIWLQRSGRDIKWYLLITRNGMELVSLPKFIHHGVPVKGLRKQDSRDVIMSCDSLHQNFRTLHCFPYMT